MNYRLLAADECAEGMSNFSLSRLLSFIMMWSCDESFVRCTSAALGTDQARHDPDFVAIAGTCWATDAWNLGTPLTDMILELEKGGLTGRVLIPSLLLKEKESCSEAIGSKPNVSTPRRGMYLDMVNESVKAAQACVYVRGRV